MKCSSAIMRHFINKDQQGDVIKSKADILFYSSISILRYILKGSQFKGFIRCF